MPTTIPTATMPRTIDPSSAINLIPKFIDLAAILMFISGLVTTIVGIAYVAFLIISYPFTAKANTTGAEEEKKSKKEPNFFHKNWGKIILAGIISTVVGAILSAIAEYLREPADVLIKTQLDLKNAQHENDLLQKDLTHAQLQNTQVTSERKALMTKNGELNREAGKQQAQLERIEAQHKELQAKYDETQTLLGLFQERNAVQNAAYTKVIERYEGLTAGKTSNSGLFIEICNNVLSTLQENITHENAATFERLLKNALTEAGLLEKIESATSAA